MPTSALQLFGDLGLVLDVVLVLRAVIAIARSDRLRMLAHQALPDGPLMMKEPGGGERDDRQGGLQN